MFKRIVTAAVSLIVLTPFLIFSHTPALLVFTTVLSLTAVYELLKCVGMNRKLRILVPTLIVVAATQILTVFFKNDVYLAAVFLMFAAYIIYLMTAAVFSKGEITLPQTGIVCFMAEYTAFGFASLILLRALDNGFFLFIFAFIVPWVCDAAAYFVGINFGKHKMIPDVSPKKTVEGAVGGIFGAVIATVAFALIMQFAFDKHPNYLILVLIAAVGGFVSQWGDLIASLLKRENGIKDYGKIFPGHGGVMDRFDSIIPTAVYIYIICRIFSATSIFFV